MFDLRDRSAIALAIHDSLGRRSRADLIFASNAFADWQEEHADRPDIAACYRAAASVYRWPGVGWPQPWDVQGISDHQREALFGGLCLPFCLLTGTPGTGKTFVLAALLRALIKEHGSANVAAAAPTGKAAVRLTEAFAKLACPLRAQTIHQLLEIGRNGHDGEGWGFRRNESRPLHCTFLAIDEASMLDTSLFACVLRACRPGTHLILVGDPNQLAPVGHGSPLRDMIASGVVPRADLTEVHRNDGGIVEACRQIRQGKDFKCSKPTDKEGRTNLLHVDALTADAAIEATLRIARKVEAADAEGITLPSYLQVIVAANKNSPLGRNAVNLKLQAALNPDGVRVEGNVFRTGDKIICTRNGFHLDDNTGQREVYVANGEMGSVFDVQGKVTRALFANPDRAVRIPMAKKKAGDDQDDDEEAGSGCDFDLGWAITCHKAQGSEWPIVVVLIDDSGPARRVCTREWLYTALSRASRQCLLVGRLPVAQQMSRRASLDRRKTNLKELLLANRKWS